jgi:hypothetical protein
LILQAQPIAGHHSSQAYILSQKKPIKHTNLEMCGVPIFETVKILAGHSSDTAHTDDSPAKNFFSKDSEREREGYII